MDLTPPDTETARAAADLAAEASPPFLVNHVYRTFWYGRAIVAEDMDLEAAFVASMLHDLGLTDAYRGNRPFEVVTMDHAARFLEGRGWDLDRIGLVENAIGRHANIAPNELPVELVVQAGAAFDVIGFPPDSVPSDVVEAVETAFTREGFREQMLAAYLAEVEAHPEGAFGLLEEKLSFSQLAESRPDPRESSGE